MAYSALHVFSHANILTHLHIHW